MSRLSDLPAGVPVPPHAYVPGKTSRHPDDWFDPIKASVTLQTPSAELHQTVAFRAGLAYLEAGFFWECHEVLEAVWMATKDPSAEREMTQALIQLANAQLKLRMERPRATHRICDMIDAHLARCPQTISTLGVWPKDLSRQVEDLRKSLI